MKMIHVSMANNERITKHCIPATFKLITIDFYQLRIMWRAVFTPKS